MSDALQQLLLQQLQLSESRTLWVIDENLTDPELRSVHAHENLHAITNRFDVWQSLQTIGVNTALNDFDFSQWPDAYFSRVIYRVSKERALVNHCINNAARLLADQGQLLLLGGKQDGIKTNAVNAAKMLGVKAKNKKHGIHYIYTIDKTGKGSADYQQRLLDSNNYSELRECQNAGLQFLSKPGVFGWDKVDRGSALLVETLRDLLQKPAVQTSNKAAISTVHESANMRVLDLGCGYGYIFLATREFVFAERFATDNNAAAVLAASANFAAQNLTVTVSLDDCAAGLAPGFDLVLCNPPFHQGFAASRDMTIKFLRQIQRLLAKQGRALLVVNQFIPLEKVAADYFAGIETLNNTESFKVVALQYPKLNK